MTTLYGEEKYRWTRRLGTVRTRVTTTLNDLEFLRKCRDGRVTPSFLGTKRKILTGKASRIYDRMEGALLRERITAYRFRLWQLKKENETLANKLRSTLDEEMWTTVDRITSRQAAKIGTSNAARKEKKWEKLKMVREQAAPDGGTPATRDNSPTSDDPSEDQQAINGDRLVVNMSDIQLQPEALEVLRRGLNFAMVPNKLPVEDLITSVEVGLSLLSEDAADELRLEAAHTIKKAKVPRMNVTWAQKKALRDLRMNEEIVITRADKGNATVILNTETYEGKMAELLDPRVYDKGVKDPTRKIENTIKRLLKDGGWDARTMKELEPGDSRIPRIYGLPKLHKPGTPLRPIVSMIGAPTYRASKVLARRLRPLVGKSFSAVRNSKHLVELLKEERIDAEDILASFDVTSLFTSLPVDDVVRILKDKRLLEGKEMELAELCLRSCYFQYKQVVYKQSDGVAMGSPLSSVVADVFMEDFEESALTAACNKPKLWLRYVDDILVVWQHGRDELEKFLAFLNNRHPAIKFTLEVEAEGRLPFLDLLIIKRPDGGVDHTVYRKPTATGRYLHAESHHHPAQKKGVVKTLANRAFELCSDKRYLQEELGKLVVDMANNGFPGREVRRLIEEVAERRRAGRTDRRTEDQPGQRISLPYVRGVTEKLGRMFKRHGVEVAARPMEKIGEILGSTKDRQWLQDQGVYMLPCDCGVAYIGQTGKKVATRIGQHCADYRLGRTKSSAVARHGAECSGQMLFDQVKVLAKETRLDRRLIREAVEIRKHPRNCNGDDGAGLSRLWWPIVKKTALLTERKHREQGSQGSRPPIGPPDQHLLIPPGDKSRRLAAPTHFAANAPIQWSST